MITKGNAQVSAHNTYSGLAIGGTLTVFDTSQYKAVDGMSYMNAISPATDYKVNFNGGKQFTANKPPALSAAGVDFSVLECVARSAKSSEVNGYKVVVFTKGGTYSMRDLRPDGFQDYDQGKTLAIFNTADPVRLRADPITGRKFGPSVIAPFSDVTIDDDNDFNDGYVVAKTFKATSTKQQLHGGPFKGELTCGGY